MEQNRVDSIIASVKTGTIDASLERISQTVPHVEIHDDLAAVVRLMQDLEDDLASSPDTLERPAKKLQNLDIAVQMLRAIAGELTPDTTGATGGIARLDDLRVVCAQALAGG